MKRPFIVQMSANGSDWIGTNWGGRTVSFVHKEAAISHAKRRMSYPVNEGYSFRVVEGGEVVWQSDKKE